jgi:ankyrin repeat protein
MQLGDEDDDVDVVEVYEEEGEEGEEEENWDRATMSSTSDSDAESEARKDRLARLQEFRARKNQKDAVLAPAMTSAEAADFLRAAEEGNINGLQIVREKPELLEVQNELGNSALHLAVLGAHLDVVKLLLDHKADVNGVNDEGNTALILTTICMADRAVHCAKLLIESNADPEIENVSISFVLDSKRFFHGD